MTRIEIIQAAFKVWGREFYFNTSLSHVAQELKVCKPALYRHFRSKQDLFEAMTTYFFDDFAEFIRPEYEKALKTGTHSKSAFIISKSIAEYFARNVHVFIFSMIKLRDRQLEGLNIVQELQTRGVDVVNFHHANRLISNLLYATLVFFMADFHKRRKGFTNSPSETEISHIISKVGKIISGGLCYNTEEIDELNYGELESRIAGTINNIEDDSLLKAVAAAVASAGPWEASMEQVAHKSGLAKSSLYGHFKSKQDMLHQLFMTETERIIDFARQGIKLSALTQEQLYLGIFSIVEYLRSKPDILVTLDWLRNRRLNLETGGKPPPHPSISLWIFEDIDIAPLHSSESPFSDMPLGRKSGEQGGDLWLSPWILFLIVNILMLKKAEQAVCYIPNSDIRSLYRFLTLGIGGFNI